MRASPSPTATVTRRDFLKTTSAGGAGLLIAFHLTGALPVYAAAASGNFEPNAYIAISPEGEIRLVVARSEMGQGVRTFLSMILA